MDSSDEDRSLVSVEPEPILYLPAVEALERIASGESIEGGLEVVEKVLEALAHISLPNGGASDLTVVEAALALLESDTRATYKKEEPEANKGFKEYDYYFHVVRLSDRPVRTLVQSLLTSYRSILLQMKETHSLTPTESGIIRAAIQNLAADLKESLQRKGEIR